MSTIVYQGLESCFETHHTENKSLRLKLSAPKSIGFENTTKEDKISDRNIANHMTKIPDSGCWNFLQSLSNCSQSPKKMLHTDIFQPSLKLSQKSLELCTENLGSETGSDATTDFDIFSRTNSMESSSAKSSTITRTQGLISSAKKTNTRSFPPPLTTISGSNSLQVRPYREGGRLIIEAVEAPSSRTCLQAERCDGRLQLRFVKNCEFFYDHKMSSEDNQDANIGESKTKDHGTNKKEDVFEDDDIEKNSANNNIVDQETNGGYMKDMNGNKKVIEVETGRERFHRHNSRCNKESGHGSNNNNGLCNWEGFWVAT